MRCIVQCSMHTISLWSIFLYCSVCVDIAKIRVLDSLNEGPHISVEASVTRYIHSQYSSPMTSEMILEFQNYDIPMFVSIPDWCHHPGNECRVRYSK